MKGLSPKVKVLFGRVASSLQNKKVIKVLYIFIINKYVQEVFEKSLPRNKLNFCKLKLLFQTEKVSSKRKGFFSQIEKAQIISIHKFCKIIFRKQSLL